MWTWMGRLTPLLFFFGCCLIFLDDSWSQEQIPAPIFKSPGDNGPAPRQAVEVQARGPIHEAFATPTTAPKATPLIPRKPPTPLEEMPPEEKPEGDVVWIGGYWSWDDDRQDFLWVSGCWRTKPAAREWVPGYWREQGTDWQWVGGFWTATTNNQPANVTYYPEPPAPPNVAPPGDPPAADMFYIPGTWVWVDSRYSWRAGFWTRVRPGYVYVPPHYRWTPHGHVYIAGYWDLPIRHRGLIYAPVVVDTVAVGPTFVYTPTYAVTDTIVLDTLFVRPAFGCYYFGDYYGPRYAPLGFESCVVYSRRHYDAVIVYQRWEYRDNPRWFDLQVNLCSDRHAGRAPLPPRTLAQQTHITNVTNVTNITNVKNVTNVTNVNNVLAPARSVVAARGGKTVAVDKTARIQAKQNAQAVQTAAIQQRRLTEGAAHPGGAIVQPRTTSLSVPALPHKGPVVHPVASPVTTKTITPPTRGGTTTLGTDHKISGPTTSPTTRPLVTDPVKKTGSDPKTGSGQKTGTGNTVSGTSYDPAKTKTTNPRQFPPSRRPPPDEGKRKDNK